jgi:hypothetical protein
MTDMELVIKMPEEEYERLPYIDIFKLRKYIENGTLLPKGHGRLIDADERRTEIDEEDRWVVDLAETIIEADKGGEE